MDEVFIYSSFFFCLAILITEMKRFKHWSEIDWDQKIWASLSVLMVVVTGTVSLLALFGAFD